MIAPLRNRGPAARGREGRTRRVVGPRRRRVKRGATVRGVAGRVRSPRRRGSAGKRKHSDQVAARCAQPQQRAVHGQERAGRVVARRLERGERPRSGAPTAIRVRPGADIRPDSARTR